MWGDKLQFSTREVWVQILGLGQVLFTALFLSLTIKNWNALDVSASFSHCENKSIHIYEVCNRALSVCFNNSIS